MLPVLPAHAEPAPLNREDPPMFPAAGSHTAKPLAPPTWLALTLDLSLLLFLTYHLSQGLPICFNVVSYFHP